MSGEAYDVIVVGAGPAGSTVARWAALGGASVLVLEKDRDIGMPVRCGEAVSNRSLETIVDIDSRWIAATIRRFRLVSPSGHVVEPDLGGYGYVLERRLFDYDLARLAGEAGAEVRTKCYVSGLLESDGAWTGVRYEYNGREQVVRGRIIVGADGVESRVGKWAGIDTTTHLRDMETCAQVTIAGADIADDACEFHFGNDVAPTGYLWVFPKGKGKANVGVGISGMASKRKHALRYLEDFLKRRYPRASVLSTIAGGVPCAPTLDTIVQRNIVLVGDAAHQVNPMTGGGITSGMVAGKLAGEAIAATVRADDLTTLRNYEKQWRKHQGNRHRTYHRMKTAVYGFSDEALDDIAARVLQLPPDKRSIWGVFKVALRHQPGLVWEMVRTFGL
ncbi:MAG TPA: NAD(P)/FAD-dependent oxidoreductase [Bacteroidota bacterium]|nr:NAD(P)/FAD-dependent oxidoreductase [Bacteroidota bacterium]